MGTYAQDPKTNKWEPAKPEPYYANFMDKIIHFFGGHIWTDTPKPRKCVMCGKVEKTYNFDN